MDLTRSQLKSALQQGAVAAIAAHGCCVRFVYSNGVDSGYLVRGDGGVKRYKSDEAAWSDIDAITEIVSS